MPSVVVVVDLVRGRGHGYGVLDEIARRVLRSGGRVLALRGEDIPDGGPAAGMLRYAI